MIDRKETVENIRFFFNEQFEFFALSCGFGLSTGEHPILNTDINEYDYIANMCPYALTTKRIKILKKIIMAINGSNYTHKIIFDLYIKRMKNYEVADSLGYGSSQYSVYKRIALLEFADNLKKSTGIDLFIHKN